MRAKLKSGSTKQAASEVGKAIEEEAPKSIFGKIAAWIDHPDGNTNPPFVRVRVDARVVFEGPMKRSQPLLIDIPATPGRTHMVIETSIDRLYRPADGGSRDSRELGLSIRDFVWE